MAITRIKNNQITDATIVASAKLVDYSITAGKIANNLTYGSDLTVSGNLTVNGTSTTIDTTSTLIEDPTIYLATGQTGPTPAADIGFVGERGDLTNIAFIWDESQDEFATVFTSDTTTNTTVTVSSYANFHTLDANVGGNIVINGTSSLIGNVVGNLSVTGDVHSGGFLTEDVISAAGNITGGNLTTGGLLSVTGNANVGNLGTGGLITATGNITGGNVNTGGLIVATGNITGGNVNTGGLIVATGNITGGNLTTVGIANIGTLEVTGTSSVVGNANVGNLGTGGLITATGNITGGNLLTGGLASVTGNVTGGNVNTGGLVTATGNVTGGNLLTGGLISATGNITGGNITTAGALTSGPLTVTGLSQFTGNVDVTGNVNVTGNLNYENVTDLVVGDPLIYFAANNSASDSVDIGIVGGYNDGTYQHSGLVRDHTDDVWKLFANVVSEPTTVIDWANATYSPLKTGAFTSTSTMSATGNIDGGNLRTAGLVTATGNVTGGNLITGGLITATGNITATANVNGGNLSTGGLITATGNITGGNLVTGGLATVTGNVIGGNLTTVGIGNIGTLEVTGSATVGTTLGVTGNANVGNLGTAGLITATGNITGGNVNTGGLIIATGNITGGNILTGGLISATGNITGGNLITTGSSNLGNIRIAGNDITSTGSELTINDASADVNVRIEGNGDANLIFIDAGTDQVVIGGGSPVSGAKLQIATTDSVLMPVGNTAQRPGTGTVGMLRFNTAGDSLEVYTSTGWEDVGVPAFTVIASETFDGDGSTVAFTLSDSQTTASCIVSINGVVQLPTTAYSVSTTTLTFTEAPLSGDKIEVRKLTTTTTVAYIENAVGNASLEMVETASQINVQGNLLPISNNVYTLGSASYRWSNLYLSGNTLTLGNIVMKNTSGNSIAFFGPDGTTPATLDANIDVTADAIASGTSNVSFAGSGGNVLLVAGGTTTGTITSTGANITGTINATGNANVGNLGTGGLITATGNITGGNLVTGALVQGATVSASGNVIAGNVNAAGLSLTGNVLSALNVTGNTTSGNLLTPGLISATGNIISGNLNTGAISASGNITGTLATASQPHITSVGTLSSLAVTGNITPGGIAMSTANATIGNLYVTGTTTIAGNITQVSGNSGQFFGNATTGFNALYAGLPAGFSLLPHSVTNFVSQSNSYSQINNQNQSAGDEATVDWVLTGDNGNDTTYFFDIGYTGSGYDPAVAVLNNALGNVVTPNDAYMYTTGNVAAGNPSNMVIGTPDTGSYVRFFVGGYYANAQVMQLNAPSAANTVTITGGITVTGNATVAAINNGAANGVGNIGTSSSYFNTVFAKATSAQYADLAEMYVADANYEPGTVVSFGGDFEVTQSANNADARVAGVISTNPSYIMNSSQQGEHVVAVALTGRVPTRVTGTVAKGDMMVSNGDGSARAEQNPRVGTVIGKALEAFSGDTGVIEVVVGRF